MTAFSGRSVADVREYWNSRPCNIRHSPQPVGSLAYWNEVEARKYLVEPHIPGFAEFDKWAGKRVLEIGCGLGTDTINFARAGAQVTAIDVSENSINLARQRATMMGVEDSVSFLRTDIENLYTPLLSDSYDLIYSFGVLHHTPNPRGAIEKIFELAEPKTELRIMLYHRYSWKVLMLTKGRIWNDKLVAKQSEAESNCPVTFTYSKKQATELLYPYFSPHSMEVDHIFPYKIPQYKQYEYVRKNWTNLPGFDILERKAGWHLLIKATRNYLI